MADHIRWADRPPPPHGSRGIKLFCCPPTGRHLLRLLGPPKGVWQHFIQGASVPCVGALCRLDPDPKLRWTAYVPAELAVILDGQKGWLKSAALITATVYHALRPHGWRGTYCWLYRSAGVGFKELCVERCERPAWDAAELPEAFDVLAVLKEVWLRRWPMLEGLMGLEHSEPPAEPAREDARPAFTPVRPAEAAQTPPEPPRRPEGPSAAEFLPPEQMKAMFRAARRNATNGHGTGHGQEGGA